MNTPRIIYYYQTFNGLKNILYQDTSVTHIHLSSIHFGTNTDETTPYIHLNDYSPYDKRFDQVWEDLLNAKKYNIKTILMVGGAGGAFGTLFSNFNTYYPLLRDLIIDKSVNENIIQGVDLDVEEYTNIADIKMLIRKLKEDFGKDFIITMAPIQMSLQEDNIGMGGFIYKDLYNSPEGEMIDYFNGQFYMDYSENAYTQVIENGYPCEKIVMGMISGENYEEELKKVYQKYGAKFGGVFIWEYYNSPINWEKNVKSIMAPNSFFTNCLIV
jgi:chitinase